MVKRKYKRKSKKRVVWGGEYKSKKAGSLLMNGGSSLNLSMIVILIIIAIIGFFLFKKYFKTEPLRILGSGGNGIPNESPNPPDITDYDTRQMNHGPGAGFDNFRKYSNPNKWILGDDGSGRIITAEDEENHKKWVNLQIPTIPPLALRPNQAGRATDTLIDTMTEPEKQLSEQNITKHFNKDSVKNSLNRHIENHITTSKLKKNYKKTNNLKEGYKSQLGGLDVSNYMPGYNTVGNINQSYLALIDGRNKHKNLSSDLIKGQTRTLDNILSTGSKENFNLSMGGQMNGHLKLDTK